MTKENDNTSISIDNLVTELQKRIGILPLVEPYMFSLKYDPHNVVEMLRVKPKSYSEIARAVRAARTMKLNVRGFGNETSGDLGIYGSSHTLVVDCTNLADSERMEFVTIKRQLEDGEFQGLKVLACVQIQELVTFQVNNGIEIAQSVYSTSIWGTVVGAITSMSPGLVAPAGGAKGACLADEVIRIRIVDCNGDLIEYSSNNDITAAVASMGMLGIVYDIVLRYNPLTLTGIKYQFHKWSDLCSLENNILMNTIIDNHIVELVYLPYNSCKSDTHTPFDLDEWNPNEDEVLLRTGRRLSVEEEEINHVDSGPRKWVYLLDEIFDPYYDRLIDASSNVPQLLGKAHNTMRARYIPHPTIIQYTPWAINSFGKLGIPIRSLKYTLDVEQNLSNFRESISAILNLIRTISVTESSNYALNLGMTIHFTSGSPNCRMMGIGWESNPNNTKEHLLAHINFMGLMHPGTNVPWLKAANRINMMMIHQIPKCMPQWRSEWHGVEMMKDKFRKALSYRTDSLKSLAAVADRDGIFLNEVLASLLYSEFTYYQKIYRIKNKHEL